jgi:hypothetical protein
VPPSISTPPIAPVAVHQLHVAPVIQPPVVAVDADELVQVRAIHQMYFYDFTGVREKEKKKKTFFELGRSLNFCRDF